MFTRFVQKTDMTVVNTSTRTLLHELCMMYAGDEWHVLDLFKFIVRLFLNAGVPINAQDCIGETALDYAIHEDFDAISAFLRENGGRSRTEL